MVRASFGCYNNHEDIDIFVDMLDSIAHKRYQGVYTLHPVTGMYVAKGYEVDASNYFRLYNPYETAASGEEVA